MIEAQLCRPSCPGRHRPSRRGAGGLTVGQFLPAGWRQYMPGIATQAAVTVHRSAGLLSPGIALAVLGGYAAIALTAASVRASRSDA
jgi:hypothetical protein